MTPREFIEALCRRYRVSSAFAQSLLPLAKRSTEVGPEKGKRIREFIERSFAAEEKRRGRTVAPRGPEEDKVVRTVAEVLHTWEPPKWLVLWARRLRARRPPSAGGEESGSQG